MCMSPLASFESAVSARYSCKNFDPRRKVPQDKLRRMIDLTLRSPSAFNLQPWVGIAVTSKAQRERLYLAALNQRQVRDAPLCMVFAGNMTPVQRVDTFSPDCNGNLSASEKYNHFQNSRVMLSQGPMAAYAKAKQIGASIYRKTTKRPMLSIPSNMQAYSWKQVMIPVTHFMLAASASGLQTACIEGIDEMLIKDIVGLPNVYSVPCIVCVGYESSPQAIRSPRKDVGSVFFDGIFGNRNADFD